MRAMKTSSFSPSGPHHHSRHNLLNRWRSDLLHRRAGLGAQDFEHAFDPGLAECPEPPQIGPTDAHGVRPHRQRLDDVGTAPKTAINQDWDAAGYRRDDIRQGFDCRATAVIDTATMVRYDDSVHANIDCQKRVFGR